MQWASENRRRVESAALVVAALLPIWVVGPIITYDGPQHILHGFLLNHIDDPGRGYDTYLELKWAWSSVFVAVLVGALERVVSIWTAERLMWTTVIVLQVTGYLRLLGALGLSRSPVRWLAPMLPFQFVFYGGYHNYCGAFGLGLWCLALLVEVLDHDPGQGDERSRSALWRWLGVSTLLLLTAFAHTFAAGILGLFSGLIVVARKRGASIVRSMAILAVASGPALVSMGAVYLERRGIQGESFLSALTPSWALHTTIARNLYETPAGIVWPVTAISLMAFLLALWPRRNRTSVTISLATLTLLLLIVVTPERIAAWNQVTCRYMPWLAVVGAIGAGFRLSAWPRAARATSWAVALSVCVSLVQVTGAHAQLADVREEVLSAIGEVESVGHTRYYSRPGSPALGLGVSHMAANAHVYYMIAEGGVFSWIMRNENLHIVRETEAWQDDLYYVRARYFGESGDRAAAFVGYNALTFDETLLYLPSESLRAQL